MTAQAPADTTRNRNRQCTGRMKFRGCPLPRWPAPCQWVGNIGPHREGHQFTAPTQSPSNHLSRTKPCEQFRRCIGSPHFRIEQVVRPGPSRHCFDRPRSEARLAGEISSRSPGATEGIRDLIPFRVEPASDDGVPGQQVRWVWPDRAGFRPPVLQDIGRCHLTVP